MKKITEEMLGLSGFRFGTYVNWNTITTAGSRLCFKNPNPLGNFHNLISWEVRSKIYSEINKIVLDKTNNKNIAENYKPIIQH